ncbi:hypothetical protein D3C79_1076100 [compost metagenome]
MSIRPGMVFASRNIITTVDRIKSYSPSKRRLLRSLIADWRLVMPSFALMLSRLSMLLAFLSHAVTSKPFAAR